MEEIQIYENGTQSRHKFYREDGSMKLNINYVDGNSSANEIRIFNYVDGELKWGQTQNIKI